MRKQLSGLSSQVSRSHRQSLAPIAQFSDKSRTFGTTLRLLAVLLCAVLSSFAQQQAVVLKGGKLLTVSHGVIENGVLVMEAGKISALGSASSVKIPKSAKVVDVTGMTVYPGLSVSVTLLGFTEISAASRTNDRIDLSHAPLPNQ